MKYDTVFTKNFRCRLPIMGAPMAGVSGGQLAYETCVAGGLGFIAAGHMNTMESYQNLQKEIQIFRDLCASNSGSSLLSSSSAAAAATPRNFPLNIGFIGHSTFGQHDSLGWEYVQRIIQENQPFAVQFFAPAIVPYPYGSTNSKSKSKSNSNNSNTNFRNNIQLCQQTSFLGGKKEEGGEGCTTSTSTRTTTRTKVIVQVGSVQDAVTALDAGCVDCIIAQGTEAGGHGLRRDLGNGTLSLTSQIVELVRHRHHRTHQKQQQQQQQQNKRQKLDGTTTTVVRPAVLAAGGIVNGKGLLAALSLGADGVVLGTRLWASTEALGRPSYKTALVQAAQCDNVVRTRIFDTISNSQTTNNNKWPYPYDSSGTLRNQTTQQWEDDTCIPKLEKELLSAESTATATATDNTKNNPDWGCVYAGEGVGEIYSIDPTSEIFQRIEKEVSVAMSCLKDKIDGG